MDKTKKMIRNFILFILLIILTFYIVLKDQDMSQIFEVLRGAKKEFILIAIVCMSLYMVCEAINIGRTLKALNEKSSFLKNLKYALIGFFFSSITPAASGGQPMQIYYMHRDKITVANSTLALLINLSSMQIVTISIALISVFFNTQYLNSTLATFFIIGITLNLTALALLLISIFSKKMTRGLIKIIIKIMKLFRIKNIEEKKEKMEGELGRYQESAKYIKQHKMLILKILLTTYIQFMLYYSISYWVYRSLGFTTHNIIEIISLQAVLFATVSGIPSPGAVGVSEGGFIALFKDIYPQSMISGAMLLSRGVNFYLFVILSSFVVAKAFLVRTKNDKINQDTENCSA